MKMFLSVPPIMNYNDVPFAGEDINMDPLVKVVLAASFSNVVF